MKKIYLTKGLYAIVDDDDYERISAYSWHIQLIKGVNGVGYARHDYRLGKERKYILMHRKVLQAKQGEVIDHRNGNRLDNRKTNLRICSLAENSRNRNVVNKNNKLGIMGVRWSNRKFIATIYVKGKTLHLGSFSSLKTAQWTREDATKKYFG